MGQRSCHSPLPTPNTTCVFTSQMLLLFFVNSPSNLSPVLNNHGVRFEATSKETCFFSYNCQSKEITLVGPMRMRMNDTGFRETQKETLNDLMEELQKKVRDIKAEIYPKNGK